VISLQLLERLLGKRFFRNYHGFRRESKGQHGIEQEEKQKKDERDSSFIIDPFRTSSSPSSLVPPPSSTYGDEWPCKKHDKTVGGDVQISPPCELRDSEGRKDTFRHVSPSLFSLIYVPTHVYIHERMNAYVPSVTCMDRERPYLIKQRVLTRQLHTFPPASNAFFHLVRTFPRYQRDLALSAFTLNLTIRAPSIRSIFTFARFQNGLKENRGFPTLYNHLRNLLNPTFYRKRSR